MVEERARGHQGNGDAKSESVSPDARMVIVGIHGKVSAAGAREVKDLLLPVVGLYCEDLLSLTAVAGRRAS